MDKITPRLAIDVSQITTVDATNPLDEDGYEKHYNLDFLQENEDGSPAVVSSLRLTALQVAMLDRQIQAQFKVDFPLSNRLYSTADDELKKPTE